MIFNLFKSDASDRPTDVKGVRYALLQFIKQELQKVEGGEGASIKGLSIYINCSAADRHVYEAALYEDEPGAFKEEIQKIADDYALELPSSWSLEVEYDTEVPGEALKAGNLDAALFVKTSKHFIKRTADGYIRILSGDTGQAEYHINSAAGKINIGRDKKAQADDGFFRTNQIAFPTDSENDANKYVSRQHAHIEWDNDSARFMLFADEGGIPPRNKIKVRSEKNETMVKLHSTQIGHPLAEGDQVILGESAVIEFSYQPLTNE